MKYLSQLTIILLIWFFGEVISDLLPIAIPGSIIGIILLFTLLEMKILKLSHVEDVSKFFLDNLAFFFIPPGISLINSLGILKANWLELSIVIGISTILVLSVSALATDFVIKIQEKRRA